MATRIECHCCGEMSTEHSLCGGCNLAVYCDKACQQKDLVGHETFCHVDDKTLVKDEFWTFDNLEGPIYESVRSAKLRERIDDLCESDAQVIPKQLRADIAHDLYINAGPFRAYMRVVLFTGGEKRVLKKLKEGGFRGKRYTQDQLNDIRKVVESSKKKRWGLLRDHFGLKPKDEDENEN